MNPIPNPFDPRLRDGLRRYLEQVAWKRPIHTFARGDFVILHKL